MVHFSEVQRLDKRALVGIILFTGLIEAAVILVLIMQFVQQPGAPFPLVPIIIVSIVGAFAPFLILIMSLAVEVRDDGLYYRLAPVEWSFRRIAFADIEKVELVEYGALRDFGGWGKRFSFWGRLKGTCYTLGGNKALAVTLTGRDRRLFLGTQRPDELLATLYGAVGKR